MFKTVSTLTVMGLLTLSAAQAQSSQTLQAHVPFAFQMQHKDFAAGNYWLTYSMNNHILYLRNMDQSSRAGFFLVSPTSDSRNASRHAKLVFTCYSNTCNLAEIWQGGDHNRAGLEVPRTEPERRIPISMRVLSLAIPAK
jgi:hypothetical protein